jgi:hypothetical protein
MTFTEVFIGLRDNTLTVEQAAKILKLTEASLKHRIAVWGRRLEELFVVLDLLQTDKITRSEAATRLGIGHRAVNRLQESWGVPRPVKPYLVKRQEIAIKWEMHKVWAIGFIEGRLTLEDAAIGMGKHPRHVRRWITKLLDKHFQMPFKDLKRVNARNRARIAQEILEAERIELDKLRSLEAISRGERTAQAEAIARVMAQPKHRGKIYVRRDPGSTS